MNALRSEVAITPAEFDGNMLDILKNISDTVVLPIAILLITYVFVLQIIEFVTDKNKGGEFDVGNVIMLIIKTTIMILLSTNAFTIALGFSDLATWMIDKVPTEQVEISADVSESLLSALEPVVVQTNEDGTEKELEDIDKVENRDTQRMDYKLGEGLLTLMVAGIGFVIVMIICGIIYLVAWSRIIMIFLYVTVAPIPMATVMSDSWVNSIGQNYLKNLMALTIQGFLMLVLMVVYNGLVSRTATLINGGEGGFMGMILIIVSMAIVAKMLIGTHGLAKSITGAS
ncbi:VirB6/TrbL-like conjugal transfer protein, CD1112 family [Enterococcus faecalis]|uniref:VirB6/TrbL-like conjugal transfer protein, CD1112 family n=1 Tax=Enterococcus faecalis TaxID=1351 RepID=UPI00103DC6EA|nr:CD0415/CD1112 family protein [Enterococcus faecalis]